jgi:hypothetical protein
MSLRPLGARCSVRLVKRNTDRTRTTHAGGLPQPAPLLDDMRGGERGPAIGSLEAGA